MRVVFVISFVLLAHTFTYAQQAPYLVVLGTAQDAGYPQADCERECCQAYWQGKTKKEMVSCLGLVDPASKSYWIIDATPDFPLQLQVLKELLPDGELKGIFLTHAHIGHYTGLMHLGREAMGTENIKVYAMPKMKTFLEENGPWSQLVKLQNISIQPMENNKAVQLSNGLSVLPLQVPHRDEYSETVGFKIAGKSKNVLFIPDIDKWEKWDKKIIEQVKLVDAAYLDATFYNNGEIPGRDMSEIPHPFIEETMEKFSKSNSNEKKKIHFIHFNHTNPVMQQNSEERKTVIEKGFSVAETGSTFEL